MMLDEDRRWRDGVTSAVAALQAGERHSIELFETLRKEIRESEMRQAEKMVNEVGKVGKECEAFRREVRERWDKDENDREKREKARIAAKWSRSQKLTVAGIVAGVLASPIMLVLGIGPG